VSTGGLGSDQEIADFETDVLAGFVLARASAGLTDSTIRNDTNHPVRLRLGPPRWVVGLVLGPVS
jgi:integrase/recombinase XerD